MPQRAAYILAWREDDQAYNVLTSQGNKLAEIVPESPGWVAWLQTISSFAFHGKVGAYTIRKERKPRGAGSWYAYVRIKGKVSKRYLGTSSNLTLALLEQIAQELATYQQPKVVSEERVIEQVSPPSPLVGGELSRVDTQKETSPVSAQASVAPLVLTKVRAPRLRSALVHRSRLIERLHQGMEGPLTLLSAPAGFGKTTLLSSWLASSNIPVAWFSIETEDNDPARFFIYLLAALQRLDRNLGSSLLSLLQLPGQVPLEAMLARLINELNSWKGSRLVLVLDDYHVVTTETIHRAITYFVEHLPPQVHLVIATRADPPLPLARLRGRGQMTELRAVDLYFGQEEADQFLHTVMGLDLSVQESTILQARTEGWIAGLQFAALALQGRTDISAFLSAFTGSHRFVLDYLSEEVLARQPKEVQSFLLHTGILERLSGPLCDAVTGQQTSQAILEVLDLANLFVVALDEERRWYRYHHLFAEVLRNWLKQTHPDMIPTLHRRASVWYEQHALLAEAVEHALAAPDVDHAARLIEQFAMVIVGQGRSHTVLGWMSTLPDALVRGRPLLSIYYASALHYTYQFDKVEARLQDAEHALQTHTPDEQTRAVRGHAAIIRANNARYAGDLGRYLTLAQQALDLLPETEVFPRAVATVMLAHTYLVSGDVTQPTERQVKAAVASAWASHSPILHARALSLLARLHMLQGRLRQAATTYEEARLVISGQEELFHMTVSDPSRIYYSGLGDLLREWNHLDEAEHLLSQSMELAIGEKPAEDAMLSYLAQARLHQARGEYSSACATLDAFIHMTNVRHFAPYPRTHVAAVRAQIKLAQGNIAEALGWVEESSLSPSDPEVSYPREREYLTLARVCIAQGRANSLIPSLDDAFALLERLLADAQPKGRMHSVIEILMLKALALHARNGLPEALDCLIDALTLARPEGYARLFLDEGEPLLSLLSRVKKADPSLQEYVQMLLLHAKVAPAPPTPLPLDMRNSRQQSLVEPLSRRELEVLELMAVGASNEEVADQLVIALGTAKRHVSNILAKLAVSNRTQAVARARELGLM